MDGSKLTKRIEQAPKTPGVYTWQDAKGTPLYIGKAANLRSRLLSYPRSTHSRIRAMMERAARLSWQETDTDIDALILESQLIKKLKPRYNIDWRDDKRYFYVGFSRDEFPRVFLTHQPSDDADLIGPFTEGEPLKATLRALRKLFPYCTCKRLHHLKCLNAHMSMCSGYCCLKSKSTAAQKKEYARNIRAIKDLLTGKRNTVIRRFAGADNELAMKLFRVFQNAQVNARHRQLAIRHVGALEQLRDELSLTDTPHRIEGYDVAHIQGTNAVGSMAVFSDGRADTSEYRIFNIKTDGGDTDMLREILERRMNHPEWQLPDLVVIDGGKAQLNVARAIFGETPVLAVRKNDRHQAEYLLVAGHTVPRKLADLPRAMRNLLVHVDAEAHRFAISRYRRRHRSSVK